MCSLVYVTRHNGEGHSGQSCKDNHQAIHYSKHDTTYIYRYRGFVLYKYKFTSTAYVLRYYLRYTLKLSFQIQGRR